MIKPGVLFAGLMLAGVTDARSANTDHMCKMPQPDMLAMITYLAITDVYFENCGLEFPNYQVLFDRMNADDLCGKDTEVSAFLAEGNAKVRATFSEFTEDEKTRLLKQGLLPLKKGNVVPDCAEHSAYHQQLLACIDNKDNCGNL